MSIRKSKW